MVGEGCPPLLPSPPSRSAINNTTRPHSQHTNSIHITFTSHPSLFLCLFCIYLSAALAALAIFAIFARLAAFRASAFAV